MTKFFNTSKMKAFADNIINVTKNRNYFWDRLETLWEKEKMLVTIVFPQCFQRPSFAVSLEVWNVC